MNVTTFDEIIKHTESLTLDEQLQLAAYLIEKARKTKKNTWQNVREFYIGKKDQISTEPETNKQATNRWRAFFESTEFPTKDFMQERVDLPAQTREIF
jgi:hypothetical protein